MSTPFASFPFTSPPPCHRAITVQLDSTVAWVYSDFPNALHSISSTAVAEQRDSFL